MTKFADINPSARPLRDEELKALLEGPSIARLGTVRRDGRPHVSPMCFLYRDGLFYFYQRKNTPKLNVRNVERNPNVSLCVDTCTQPYQAVMVDGLADITEEDADDIALEAYIKYFGAEDGREMFDRLREESPIVLIRVRPTKTTHFSCA